MEFYIKTYFKGELAKKYKVSLKTFNTWIKDIPGLAMLYPRQKILTPKQVRIIVEYLHKSKNKTPTPDE